MTSRSCRHFFQERESMPDLRLPSGPLRIRANEDEYLTRLVKLIPAEVVALYLSFKEVASSWLGIWAFICLLLVVVVRVFGSSTTQPIRKSPQLVAIGVSCVSFILWIYAMGGYIIEVALPVGAVSVAIGLWTFVVPYFYKGD